MAKKNKKVVVNKKFMLDLANSIYDPSTKKFMYLCDGTLQNGPDPKQGKPMHCGLGELYFAMTGNQPKQDGVDEEGVVQHAVELAQFQRAEALVDEKRAEVAKALKNVDLDDYTIERMISLAEDSVRDDFDDVDDDGFIGTCEFRRALDDIPSQNDDECGDDCSVSTYRERAKRVAKQFREAAKYLPT